MSVIALVALFLHKYLVPFLFAVGLFYFIYGCIEYFIIGKGGDEGRAEHGRELFLKSIAWFVLALILYAIASAIGWLSTVSFNMGAVNTPGMPEMGAGAEVDRNESILPVPNVPTR
jgi:hypothetical protein